jgi:hypothetical protein
VVVILRLGNGDTWHGPSAVVKSWALYWAGVEGIDVLELQQTDGSLEAGRD